MDRARTFSYRTVSGLVRVSVDHGTDWIEVKTETGPPRSIRLEGIVRPELIDPSIQVATQLLLIDARVTKGHDPVPDIR